MVRLLKPDLDGLAEAASIVAGGGVICFPTDTVYGLGCDPFNATALERTIQAKGSRTKPVPILVHGLRDADGIAELSESARILAKTFWPGPLTIIVSAKGVLPKTISPNGTVGIRSPNLAICLSLLMLCKGVLVGTSANITGQDPAKSALEAARVFGDKVDAVLDGGNSPLGVASSVVDLTKPRLMIPREGPIGRAEILRCLKTRAST